MCSPGRSWRSPPVRAARTGAVRCQLSDETCFAVLPAERAADDDPPNWELITPDGLALEFGPGLRWQIASADALARSRTSV